MVRPRVAMRVDRTAWCSSVPGAASEYGCWNHTSTFRDGPAGLRFARPQDRLRARGLRPRPGMTMLRFKLRHYPETGSVASRQRAWNNKTRTLEAEKRVRSSALMFALKGESRPGRPRGSIPRETEHEKNVSDHGGADGVDGSNGRSGTGCHRQCQL